MLPILALKLDITLVLRGVSLKFFRIYYYAYQGAFFQLALDFKEATISSCPLPHAKQSRHFSVNLVTTVTKTNTVVFDFKFYYTGIIFHTNTYYRCARMFDDIRKRFLQNARSE